MMEPTTPQLEALARRAQESFTRHYGSASTHSAAAPGRVNLMGDHTDYNGGLVLPMAIDRHTVVAADRAGAPDRVRIASAALTPEASLSATTLDLDGTPAWARYVVGVLAGYHETGMDLGGLRLWVDSDVPLGSGLSSSAALEVATATVAEAMSDSCLEPMERARLCQKAEHEYAGVPCGIMDQVASIFGKSGHAVLLDCRSLDVEMIPIANDEIVILIIDSGVSRALADSHYAARRNECDQAALALSVSSLREVLGADLDARLESLAPVPRRRAHHVISENERVVAAANELRGHNWRRFGELMWASHESLRDEFEVSCGELDTLVEIAREIGETGGVFGSRMTGAGFGGCTVTLVRRDAANDVAAELTRAYQERTDLDAHALLTSAGNGARVLSGGC